MNKVTQKEQLTQQVNINELDKEVLKSLILKYITFDDAVIDYPHLCKVADSYMVLANIIVGSKSSINNDDKADILWVLSGYYRFFKALKDTRKELQELDSETVINCFLDEGFMLDSIIDNYYLSRFSVLITELAQIVFSKENHLEDCAKVDIMLYYNSLAEFIHQLVKISQQKTAA